MGSQKQLPLEKERPACHLTSPLSCWTHLPSLQLPSLSYLLAMFPCLTPFKPNSAPPAHVHGSGVAHSLMPSHQLPSVPPRSFNKGKCLFSFSFFFTLFHSCLPCKVLQLKFTPGLLCATHFPFHISPPTNTYKLINASPHQIAHRHLLIVIVTIFLYLPGLTFHPGNKHVTLPSNRFIIINFHS